MSSLFAHHVQSEQQHVPDEEHSPEWSTPRHVFDPLNQEFGFDLDVCASDGNAKCDRYFTRSDDGLQQDWGRSRCWMNPPYGRGLLEQWLAKALESSRNGAFVVALLPVDTSTDWWHNYVVHAELRFRHGRIKFGGASGSPRFANVVAIFWPRCSCCGSVLREART